MIAPLWVSLLRTSAVSALLLGLLLVAVPVAASSDLAAPANDAFGAAEVIPGDNGTVSGTNVGATKEDGEPAQVGGGGATVWYRWTPTRSGRATFDTFGSGFDTTIEIYTGSDVSALTRIASNDDASDLQVRSRVGLHAVAGTAYSIAVDGFRTSRGDITLNWRREAPPNDDLWGTWLGDHDRRLVFGDNVLATKEDGEPDHGGDPGGASVWYSWKAPATGPVRVDTIGSDFDTTLGVYTGQSVSALTPLAGDDDSAGGGQSLLTFDATADGIYRIAVDGKGGASGQLRLNLLQQLVPPPGNDDFAHAALLSGSNGSVEGTNQSATFEAEEPQHWVVQYSSGVGATVWYRWTAPVTGLLELKLKGGELDRALALYTGTSLDDLTLVERDQGVSPMRMRLATEVGATYWMAIDSRYHPALPVNTSPFTLSWAHYTPPANDDFVDAEPIEGVSGLEVGANSGATLERGEPRHAEKPDGASVWYRWTAPETRTYRIETADIDFNTVLAVYTGDSVSDPTPIAANDNWAGLGRHSNDWVDRVYSKVVFEAIAGTEYRIAVAGQYADIGNFTLRWKPSGAPNDDYIDRIELSGTPVMQMTSNVLATKQSWEPDLAGNPGGASLWFTWEGFDNTEGTLTVDTRGSSVPTLLAVYEEAYGERPSASSELGSDSAVDGNSEVTVPVVNGDYAIALDGLNDGSGAAVGDIVLNLRFVPHNDDFADAEDLGNGFFSTWSNTSGATAEPREPEHAGSPADGSVWFRWRAPATGPVDIEMSGSHVATRIAAYTGTEVGSLTEVASDAGDATSPGSSRALFDATENTYYWIAIDGHGGASGVVAAHLAMPVSAPQSALARNQQLGQDSVPVLLDWTGPEGGLLEHYDIEQQANEGTWVAAGAAAATQAVLELAPNSGYKFRVRERETTGRIGEWKEADGFILTTSQDDDAAVSYRGPWSTLRRSWAYGGRLARSTAPGARARFTVTGDEVGIVATRGPSHGKANVYVDGAFVKRLDLYSARRRPRSTVFRHSFATASPHVVKVEVLHRKNRNATGYAVEIDAFSVIG